MTDQEEALLISDALEHLDARILDLKISLQVAEHYRKAFVEAWAFVQKVRENGKKG